MSRLGDGIDLEFDVIHADYFASVNVDDLLIEEIAFEQEQSFSAVGDGPVAWTGRGVNVGVDGGDGGKWKNAIAGFGFDNQRGNASTVFLWSERDFAHPACRRA